MTTDKFTGERTDLPIMHRQNYPQGRSERQKNGQNYPLISFLKSSLSIHKKHTAKASFAECEYLPLIKEI